MDSETLWLLDALKALFPGPDEDEEPRKIPSIAGAVFKLFHEQPLNVCILVHEPGTVPECLIMFRWDPVGFFRIISRAVDGDDADALAPCLNQENLNLADLKKRVDPIVERLGLKTDLLIYVPREFLSRIHEEMKPGNHAADTVETGIWFLYLAVESMVRKKILLEPEQEAEAKIRWFLYDFMEGSTEAIKAAAKILVPPQGSWALGFKGRDGVDVFYITGADYNYHARLMESDITARLKGLGLPELARVLSRMTGAETVVVYDAAAYRDLTLFLLRQPTPPRLDSILLSMERWLQFVSEYGTSWAMAPAPLIARPLVSTALAMIGFRISLGNLSFWSIPRLVYRLGLQRFGADGQWGLWVMDKDKPLVFLALRFRDAVPFRLRVEAGDDVAMAAPVGPDPEQALKASRHKLESSLDWVDSLCRIDLELFRHVFQTNWPGSISGSIKTLGFLEKSLKSGSLAFDPQGPIRSQIRTLGFLRTLRQILPWFFSE